MSRADFPSSSVPEIIFDGELGFAALHRRAWELAWDHVVHRPGVPQSPYMDEAHSRNLIWIWDTCFMALFCKYAPDHFPGVESLDNFYKPIHDGAATTLRIHHLDNPPLFAWVEWENFRFTGNEDRLRAVWEAGYLQKHFALMERLPLAEPLACSPNETFFRKTPHGYHWAGCCSGMDNTPRGGGGIGPKDDSRAGYPDILWVDALAQQALSARCIADIAAHFGDKTEEESYRRIHTDSCALLNRLYWDEADGIYYDIRADDPDRHFKVKTPACFWPMLAGAPNAEQARRLAALVEDPKVFGGQVPFPSVDRSSPHFHEHGLYWQGGVWLPLAYMAIKALEQYGFREIASDAALKLVRQMERVWREVEPHTIWEAYSPTKAKPSTHKRPEQTVRPDFCGWSALGPISLMIENVIGLHCDACAGVVTWHLHHQRRQGVRNLRFGQIAVTLIYDGHGTIDVEADHPFELHVNGHTFPVAAGQNHFPINLIEIKPKPNP